MSECKIVVGLIFSVLRDTLPLLCEHSLLPYLTVKLLQH